MDRGIWSSQTWHGSCCVGLGSLCLQWILLMPLLILGPGSLQGVLRSYELHHPILSNGFPHGTRRFPSSPGSFPSYLSGSHLALGKPWYTDKHVLEVSKESRDLCLTVTSP